MYTVYKPKITSIVLTWNSADFIEECLTSLLGSNYPSDILVIDNDSADSTRELVTKKFPTIRLVNSGSNLGYAGGNNFGITFALRNNPDYVFILNPDATIAPDAIELLVQRMESEQNLAVASPIICTTNTNKIWYAGSTINWVTGTTPHEGCNEEDGGQFKNKKYTERANGCAILVRTSAIEKIGLMDENYFLYYEETDWSVRFTQCGYKVGLVPEAKVWHLALSSTSRYSRPLYQYYMTRNKFYFMSKFRRKYVALTLFLSVFPIIQQLAMILLCTGFADFWRSSKAYAKAYYDFTQVKLGKQFIYR